MADESNPLNRYVKIAEQWARGSDAQKAAVNNGSLSLLIAAEHLGNVFEQAVSKILVTAPNLSTRPSGPKA